MKEDKKVDDDTRVYEKIAEAASSMIRDEVAWIRRDVPGDSPIERALATALQIVGRFGGCEYRHVLWARSEAELETLKSNTANRHFLLIEPQKQLPDWRVDFLVHAYGWSRGEWRSLIVECDGHDFHERTREQAKRDRSRDRAAQKRGKAQVYRFTGSEIWRDPWGCANEIYRWAAEGL